MSILSNSFKFVNKKYPCILTDRLLDFIMPLKTTKYLISFFIAFLFFASSFTNVFAQETDTIVPIEDAERILKKIDIRDVTLNGFNFWQDKFSGHWAGIDFGFKTFMNRDYSGYNEEFMNNDILHSNLLCINLIQKSFNLQHNRNTIGLVTGLGINFESYRLDNNTTIERLSANDRIVPNYLYFDDNQKSKLFILSLSLPLLAEFQIPIDHYKNRLYFSGGIYLGYRLTSNTKIKYRVDGKKEKLKTPDHYSMYDFKYGLMFRTGYRWINVFATYELTPFFKDGKGPVLIPFTFGFTLIRF